MQPSSKFVLNPALFNNDLYIAILRLWLPTYPEPSSHFTQADVLRWFAPSATTDKKPDSPTIHKPGSGPKPLRRDCRTLHSHLPSPVSETVGAIPTSAHSALSLSILLDQFPRNLFRGPAQAVVYTHYDRLSRAVASQIRSLGLDRAESFVNAPVWRLWFYMPLEHSESMTDHELFRATLEQMLEKSKSVEDEMGAKFVEKAMGFEEKHLEPLREFGRFPWRNRWLGRGSTAAERKYLEERDDKFGSG